MNKPVIIGLSTLCALGYFVVSCSGSDKNTTTSSSGGQGSSTGGSGSQGGKSNGGSSSVPSPYCMEPDAGKEFVDGGLVQVGSTDPSLSITLGDGGFYTFSTYKGYCFTYADTGGSSLYPPCGDTGPCFTIPTGMCLTAALGAGSTNTWGGGFGCSLNQASGSGTATLPAPISGKSNIVVSVYGCKIPDKLQVQLNVANPPSDDAGTPGSGYFCSLAPLGLPDAKGTRSATIKISDLRQDCWLAGGASINTETMVVKSIQAQINAVEGVASTWDFCVSKLAIE